MDLKTYFENARGTGVLATADDKGRVDMAIYARPHVMEDGTIALIMRDRLSHANLQQNPQAAYLFIKEGPGFRGRRLFLTRLREERDSALLGQLRRRSPEKETGDETKFLVFFKVDKVLPLVGAGEAGEQA
jgi:hypothetical protein